MIKSTVKYLMSQNATTFSCLKLQCLFIRQICLKVYVPTDIVFVAFINRTKISCNLSCDVKQLLAWQPIFKKYVL